MKAVLFLLFVTTVFCWDSLVASKPSPQAQLLYQKLQDNYGKHIISGQCFYFDQLKNLVGKTPVIQGFDLQNYSPHNPWHDDWSSWDDGSIQNAINFYHSTGGQGIVSFHWHWFSPMGGNLRTSTFYTQYTDFDVSRAVIPGTPEHYATERDIEAIANQLKKLKDAGVPVLWRPLHEAGGRWFWWGAKGPAAAKALLEMMWEILNNKHQLNNLIWVWSTPEIDWYPGRNRVDIIGYDSYPGAYNYDCNLNMYMQLHNIVNGSKLIALSENGPIPDVDTCFKIGAHWSYFMSWSDLVSSQNDINHLKWVYNHQLVLAL